MVEDREQVIHKIHDMLKPGGVFISSTVCIGNALKVFKYLIPIGQFFGLIPLIKVFAVKDLQRSLLEAEFEIDHEWLPGNGKVAFFVAKKVA